MYPRFRLNPTTLAAILAAVVAPAIEATPGLATEESPPEVSASSTAALLEGESEAADETSGETASEADSGIANAAESAEAEPEVTEVAVDIEDAIDTAESLLLFGYGESRIRPIRGPIPDSEPEVYTEADLDDLRKGFFFAPNGGFGRETGAFVELTANLRSDNGNTISVAIAGGETLAALDVSYTQPAIVGDESRLGFRARAGFRNSTEAVFLADEDAPYSEVFLPIGEEQEPWVNRLGASAELFIPLDTEDTVLVPGLSFQSVRISNSAFGDDEFARDGCFRTSPIAPACDVVRGNRLSFDDDGEDELFYLSLFLQHDSVETSDTGISLSGTRYQIGTEQAIPVGDSELSYNRLSGGVIHYIPLNLFGFDEGPRVLALNLQAGTILGDDFPAYEAFTMGGYHSVRGFATGDTGTAKSFAQLLAEYRFPIVSVGNDFFESVRGSLYLGYATDFDSSDDVPGQPGPVRTKPGGGVAVGAGLLFDGLPIVDVLRVDAGLNGLGEFRLYFGLSQRF